MVQSYTQLTNDKQGFFGDRYFLSNFYPCVIVYDEREWPSVEHAYQAMKTTNLKIQEFIRQEVKRPGEVKQIMSDRLIPLRPDWNKIKFDIMYELLKIKFNDPQLAQRLIDTGTERLIEWNTWHDNTWGVCTCPRCQTYKPAKNALGRLLMDIRDHLTFFGEQYVTITVDAG